MSSIMRRFAKDESGATAIEYGLIAALIAVVCITMWRNIGSELLTKFTDVRDGLK
jgi:pilus assembly protein Flp/PilA